MTVDSSFSSLERSQSIDLILPSLTTLPTPSLFYLDRERWNQVVPIAKILHFAGGAKPMSGRITFDSLGHPWEVPLERGLLEFENLWWKKWELTRLALNIALHTSTS